MFNCVKGAVDLPLAQVKSFQTVQRRNGFSLVGSGSEVVREMPSSAIDGADVKLHLTSKSVKTLSTSDNFEVLTTL